jgi:hypothetical protein
MQPQMQPYPAAPPAPSGFGGLVSIFYSPSDAFTGGKRAWILPLVATCFFALLTNTIVVNRVGLGTIVRGQLESNEKLAAQLGPEGINQAVARAENSPVQKVMMYVGTPIAVAVVLAAFAGIAFGCLTMISARTTYGAVLTSCAWGGYAASVVACAGMTAVVYSMTDFSAVDMKSLFALNAGIFAGHEKPVLRALLGGIDLLAAWVIFLETVGVKKLSERVSTMQAVGTFVALHVVVTGARAGWAAMFG